MANINIKNADIHFPIFNSENRGLLNTVLRYRRRHEKRMIEKRGVIQGIKGLSNICLRVDSGDRLGIIGSNGAGKTTMLKMMSGIYEPTNGFIKVQGRISALTDITLGMDMDASGYENILIRSMLYGLKKRQAIELFEDIEEFTELGDYLNIPLRTYSAGMLVRLAFAIATATSPEIILMDEMIGAGDNKFIEKAQNRLNNFIDKVDILVLATHNEQIMKRFCNRAILLQSGKIIYDGDVDRALSLLR